MRPSINPEPDPMPSSGDTRPRVERSNQPELQISDVPTPLSRETLEKAVAKPVLPPVVENYPEAFQRAEEASDHALSISGHAFELDRNPMANPLAQAAAHLQARDAHQVAAFWHKEARMATDSDPSEGNHQARRSYQQFAMEGHQREMESHDSAWRPILDRATPETRMAVGGIAKAYYVTAWANAMEEAGHRFSPGTRIDEEAPEAPVKAYALAVRDAQSLCTLNQAASMDEIMERAVKADRKGTSFDVADKFGWCMGMEMLGHGVSWRDDHEDFGYKAPHSEFYVDSSDAILDWAQPGTDLDFTGYVTDDVDDARFIHDQRGGFLLKVRENRFVVCQEEVAEKAWGRSPEDLDQLTDANNYSEVPNPSEKA